MLLYFNTLIISFQPVNYCWILKWINQLVIKLNKNEYLTTQTCVTVIFT